MRAYAEAVCREILTAATTIGKKITVESIHFGGGTPTWGPREGLSAIVQTLRANFDVSADAEIAFEIDPRTVTPDLAAFLAGLGVNRVSLGVQDFDPLVQEAINRPQPFEQVERVVDDLRAAGITRINMDLMYGLPLQTEEGIVKNVELALALSPQRIALFGYAHVPWMKKHQQLLEKHAIPEHAERFAQFTAAQHQLKRHGFEQIGIDHFAHPSDELAKAVRGGALYRNFQGYTTDTASSILGFGMSAISSLPQGYAQNAPDLKEYMNVVAEGALPIVRGRTLTEDDRRRRALITNLMCYFKVHVPNDLYEDSAAKLAELEGDGIVAWDEKPLGEGRMLYMTEQGRPWVRVAAACFDAYFKLAAARHARAV